MRRPGNKSSLMGSLFPLFPKHFTTLLEPFTGGMGATQKFILYYGSKLKYIYINDMDKNVFNVWLQLRENFELLEKYITEMPYDKCTYNYLKTATPQNDTERAAWFLCLNSWGFRVKPDTLLLGSRNSRRMLLNAIITDFNILVKCTQINNTDYEDFLSSWEHRDILNTFAYFDPPYVGTDQKSYDTPDWQLPQLARLMDVAISYGFKFGISEFSSPEVVELAESKGLRVNFVKDRMSNSVKNVTEILITNYDTKQVKQSKMLL